MSKFQVGSSVKRIFNFYLFLLEFKCWFECLGPYHVECTGSRPITEVKQRRARPLFPNKPNAFPTMLTDYEQQFGVVCADITNKISRSVNLADKSQAVQSIDALFVDAREIIEQMELEVRDINSAQKRTPEQKEKYLNITNSYKSELDKLELEYNRQIKNKSKFTTDSTYEIQLNDHNGVGGASKDETELNDLQQKNSSSLLKMNSSLDNGYRMVLESEETGKNILSDLFSQRETVERARDRLREANMNLGKSSRIVGAMTRRLMQNKLILFGMCVLLFLFVVFIIYFVIKRKS